MWAEGRSLKSQGQILLHSSLMPQDRAEMPDEPPPFLGSWPRVYTAVLVYLAALIVLFWAFTRTFS